MTTFTLLNNYLITIIIYIIKGHFWFSTKQQPINSEWKFNLFAFRQNPDISECWKVFCPEWMGSFMVFIFSSIKSIYFKHLPRKYFIYISFIYTTEVPLSNTVKPPNCTSEDTQWSKYKMFVQTEQWYSIISRWYFPG